MTSWADWSICPVTCGTGIQLRKRSCVFENKNLTANANDYGCKDGYYNGYYEEKVCTMSSCRKFLSHFFQTCLS